MNRNKIEKWILSQEHSKHPNRIFLFTLLFVLITIIFTFIIT